MLYETLLTQYSTVKIRVKANSPSEAQDIFEDFMASDGGEYYQEELDASGSMEWKWGPFNHVSPNQYDECATITKNEDGTYEARYEGGEE